MSTASTQCAYNLPDGVFCPASPFCRCVDDQPHLTKPLPDPEQLDIYDVIEDQ